MVYTTTLLPNTQHSIERRTTTPLACAARRKPLHGAGRRKLRAGQRGVVGTTYTMESSTQPARDAARSRCSPLAMQLALLEHRELVPCAAGSHADALVERDMLVVH